MGSGFWEVVGKMPNEISPVHNTAVAYDNGIAFLFSGFPSTDNRNTILKFNSRAGMFPFISLFSV